MKRNLCDDRLVSCQLAFLDGGEPRQLFGVVQCLTCRVLEYEGGGGCERRIFTSLGAKLVSCSQSRSLRLWWKIGLVSVAGFRMGRAAKNEPHQHVANWRALPSVERLGMNTYNQRQQVCWQCGRLIQWLQSKSSRQLLPSYWESLKSHLCFAWWKETCVMTDWFGVSLRSLTLDNLDSSSVLSSVWPAGSWSMWWQLVVSEESSLLVLNLCHVVNPEAATCGER